VPQLSAGHAQIQRDGECERSANKGEEADYFVLIWFTGMVQVTAYGSVPSAARPLAPPLAKRTGAVRFIAVATLALGAFAAVIMVGQTRPGTLPFSNSVPGIRHRNVHFRMLMYLWCGCVGVVCPYVCRAVELSGQSAIMAAGTGGYVVGDDGSTNNVDTLKNIWFDDNEAWEGINDVLPTEAGAWEDQNEPAGIVFLLLPMRALLHSGPFILLIPVSA
jgi:hypothetical protein